MLNKTQQRADRTESLLLLLALSSYRQCHFFFFNDTATTEIYTLSLHDALPSSRGSPPRGPRCGRRGRWGRAAPRSRPLSRCWRSEEHTSELQSHVDLWWLR